MTSLKVYPEQGGVVEGAELMRRFERGRRNQENAPLLDSQGYAVRTDLKDVG